MKFTRDIIGESEAVTLHGLFRARLRRTPDALAYLAHDRRSGKWQEFRWRDVGARVASWQEALAREGLIPGDRVAILLRNGVDWIASDQACLGLGLVVVPLYVDDRPENVGYILDQVDARLLLIQDTLRWRRLEEACGPLPMLKRTVILDGVTNDRPADERVKAADDWLPKRGFELRDSLRDPAALATVVYTSGTVGRPKGVMLSHHNILAVVESALEVVPIVQEDVFLSFLPLSHMFERAVGYYLPLAAGSTVAFARSVSQLGEDLQQVRPTALVAVPRIFERVYGRVLDQLDKASPLRRALFHLAVRIGWERFEHAQGRRRWSPLLSLWPLASTLVARPIFERLGGRLRIVACGGASLPPPIAHAFIGLGLPVLQGYGLTETSPQVSVNRLDDNDPASVGKPLPGVEVRIGDQEELLVRSPGNMLGYWKNAEATAATLRDGWLHTGDQARLGDGRIYITGRLKDVLVLSNGEKVPPAEMELSIALDPLVEQIMIVGEGRPFLSAIVVLNTDRWQGLARQLGLDPSAPASLDDQRVHHEVLTAIGRRIRQFPTWAKVRRVHLTFEPWTIENGFLTPTLKTKRGAVLEYYRDAVERIYDHAY